MFVSNERSIITSIYTRIAIDVAQNPIRHVRLDDNKRYIGDYDSNLNNCLSLEPNIDQEIQAFLIDTVLTMFTSRFGCAAIVPTDLTADPTLTGSWDILSMRVGEVVEFFPRHVRVSVFRESTGQREEITLEKRHVALVYNPLYAVMNEPNSTLQRIIRKLGILDAVDEQAGSGKLDLIIQLPYVIKSEARREQANRRRKDIEEQLKGSKYGIAYTDGTEKITQLNRSAENNMLAQIEYLMKMLYGQLGITEEVMNGTADEKAMLNYMNRTIEPILNAIVNEMKRKFLTKTARTQKQSIEYFKDPFKLVPVANLAEIADKFTRNEILTSNEIRQFIGIKPHDDPKADMLLNSNMPHAMYAPPASEEPSELEPTDDVIDVESWETTEEELLGEFDTKVEALLAGGPSE